jgi:hypothetical protein
MTPYLGGWRINTQEFARQAECLAVGKGDLKYARYLMQLDFRGLRRSFVDSSHQLSPRRRLQPIIIKRPQTHGPHGRAIRNIATFIVHFPNCN